MKHAEPAKPGTKLAGYSVLAEVGRGAASIIYLVQDPRTKQVWALKHVRKDGPKDQRFLDQAEMEAEVGSKVRHDALRHIEKCIKARALLAVKELFLVMEYVDGVSLESNPPASLAGALDIFHQVARGLAHMHGRGFVHADMKPHNIVVKDDGSVKIIDLGQACATGTVKPRIQGTPDYIAPEQVLDPDVAEIAERDVVDADQRLRRVGRSRKTQRVGLASQQIPHPPTRHLMRGLTYLSSLAMNCTMCSPSAYGPWGTSATPGG